MNWKTLFLILLFPIMSVAQDFSTPHTFVVLKTSMGEIRMKLFNKESPKTVLNFIELAKGLKPYRDAITGKKIKETPFYKDMIFHKVHPQLGIQTGCPWGNGKGWPGFTISDETSNKLNFDRPYLVAMAKIPDNNNSAGSQFFITTKKQPHLNGKYTIFGEVVTGQEIVRKISKVARDSLMKPLKPIQLQEVVVE